MWFKRGWSPSLQENNGEEFICAALLGLRICGSNASAGGVDWLYGWNFERVAIDRCGSTLAGVYWGDGFGDCLRRFGAGVDEGGAAGEGSDLRGLGGELGIVASFGNDRIRFGDIVGFLGGEG